MIHLLVMQEAQGKLLEVVLALGNPRRLARACTAGSSSAIKMPMIVMTTSSSTSVKPCRNAFRCSADCVVDVMPRTPTGADR